jgi:hypothetical protein
MLRPQDLLVLLKLALVEGLPWTYDSIAHELNLSSSAVHRSVERSVKAALFNLSRREVERAALLEFLVHGVRYAFPAEWGGESRGIPTAWAAAPLAGHFAPSSNSPPVWPAPFGKVWGIALEPLDPRVPDAVLRDERLGELLALVDGIRIGAARERSLAAKELKQRMPRSRRS